MRSSAIVDSHLSINHSLDHTLRANSLFLTNPANRAHLANQLLLYDRVIIPTKDFGIVPILIYWFGYRGFEEVLSSDAISFLHKPGLLCYLGNGLGINSFIMESSENIHPEWWQDALFSDSTKAIDIQLQYMCPFLSSKQRNRLVTKVTERSRLLKYDNEFFINHVVNESYADIKSSSDLYRTILEMCGNPLQIDLARLPVYGPEQMRVLDTNTINSSVDIILRVAEINMAIVMGYQSNNADINIPQGAETLLRNKLIRAKVNPTALEGFISLLDLENIPDPGAAIFAGEKTIGEIWDIRQKRGSQQFRKWLMTSDVKDVRELEKRYVNGLGRKSFYESLPTRVVRFAITAAFDFVSPVLGLATGVADSFFIEKWTQGYSPRVFLDQFRELPHK